LNPGDRSLLMRATTEALKQAPADYAHSGLSLLSEQLGLVSDSYATNEFFCESVIEFADALVLAYLSDDLSIGETGRRFLEEDEYLVRRRVHRDMEQG
jgi:cellulose synthase operon protein C